MLGLNNGNGVPFVGDEVDLDEVTITGGTIIPTTSQIGLSSTDRLIMLIDDENRTRVKNCRDRIPRMVPTTPRMKLLSCSIFSW